MSTRRNLLPPALAVLAALLQACVIWPHRSEVLAPIRGRVVDARTLEAVSDAHVSIHGHPKTEVISDASGAFTIGEQREFFLGYTIGMCCGDWPDRNEWTTDFDVTHPGYEPFRGEAESEAADATGGGEGTLRVIHLMPRQR